MNRSNLLDEFNITSVNSGAVSGSEWCGNTNNTLIDSVNPSNGKLIAKISLCNESEYEEIIQRAQHAFQIWQNMPAPKRGDIVRQIADALRHSKDSLGSLVALEMGKSKQEGDGEVQEMIDIADFAVGQSRMLYGKTMHSERPEHRMYEQWHPLGIVGVISAFNFPVAVWSWNAFIAAICGNVVIWKPSEKTSLCAIAVQSICNKVLQRNNLPPIFSLMIANSDISERLVSDNRIPLISFTGSTTIGKKVATKVASRLGRTILELGGNNAIIIDKEANLDIAIPAVVFGAVGTCGQRCTTTRRLFIHQSIYQTVLEQLKTAYQQITIGNPLDSKYLMGPLIDEQAVLNFKSAIKRALKLGGKIEYGGSVIDKPGFFVEPTIISKLDNGSEIIQQETFAPILYVMPYSNLEDAIAMQNNVPQGLSSAIFTKNLHASELFLSTKGSDCGIANVNIGTSGAEIGGAFGGEKETGGGREAGSDAWKGYMRRQTTTINWGLGLPLAQGISFSLNRGK